MIKLLFYPKKGIKLGEKIPRISSTLKDVTVDLNNLNYYNKVCHLKNSPNLPILYPHVMAGVSQLNLFSHPEFPIKMLGTIHMANKIVQTKPLPIVGNYQIKSRISNERYFNKGIEFDLITNVFLQDEEVWTETSTYRKNCKFQTNQTYCSTINLEKLDDFKTVDQWNISWKLGKQYATISKDFNPIHLSMVLAKAFGFKKDLAHGFCVLAQAMGKIHRIPIWPCTLDVIFKGPSYMGRNIKLVHNPKNKERFDLYAENNHRPVICFKLT